MYPLDTNGYNMNTKTKASAGRMKAIPTQRLRPRLDRALPDAARRVSAERDRARRVVATADPPLDTTAPP
jgi:hypothetical protein